MDNNEEDIAKVVAGLPRVNAPDNFEGMVRSRIAEARPSTSTVKPILLLGAKFALPLVLLVILGAVLIFSGEGSMDQTMVPAVRVNTDEIATFDSSPDSSSSVPTDERANSKTHKPSGKILANGASEDLPGISEDFARSQDNSTVFPRGVDPRKAIVPDQGPPSTGSISPVSVLSMIGISSRCVPDGCTVVEIRIGSIAEKVGVKAGDLVEAIDDRAIGSTRSLSGTVSVSSLQVLRDGRRIAISVKHP